MVVRVGAGMEGEDVICGLELGDSYKSDLLMGNEGLAMRDCGARVKVRE